MDRFLLKLNIKLATEIQCFMSLIFSDEMNLKKYILIFLIISYSALFSQEKIENTQFKKDEWSGRYRMQPLQKDSIQTNVKVFYKIEKIADLNPADVAVRYEADVERWIIYPENDPKEKSTIRKFLYNKEDNEYEEFGWTSLHQQGKMKCLDAGNFFVCKTTKNTKVPLGEDESLYTKSGFFGILLHYGGFELYEED